MQLPVINPFFGNRLALASSLAFGLLGSSSVQAAFTWDGGDGTSQLWSTGANWTAQETAPANSFSGTFTLTGSGTQFVRLAVTPN